MTTLLGIAGSLRGRSFNRALLDYAREVTPAGVSLDVAGIDGIPVYDGDLENGQGLPAAVIALKDRLAAADGLILATPEYNGSVPGALKNAIDWLSRPSEDIARVFHDRPVAVLGATPGGLGTALAQNAWLPVLRTLRMRPWFQGRLMVSGAHKLVDEHGRLTDERTRSQVADFVVGFAAFVQESGTRSG
jgi:NAD(P)H-dependent FMN reductase